MTKTDRELRLRAFHLLTYCREHDSAVSTLLSDSIELGLALSEPRKGKGVSGDIPDVSSGVERPTIGSLVLTLLSRNNALRCTLWRAITRAIAVIDRGGSGGDEVAMIDRAADTLNNAVVKEWRATSKPSHDEYVPPWVC